MRGVEGCNGYHGRPATTSVTVHLKEARSGSIRLHTSRLCHCDNFLIKSTMDIKYEVKTTGYMPE